MDRYRGVLFDIDGVLRHGRAPVPGAGEVVAEIRARGVRVGFVTNNAAATPRQVAQDLAELGVPATAEEVTTSAQGAAWLLDPGTRCLVIGMEGLHQALAERSCPVVTEPEAAQAVVVGLDHELRWDDLRRATLALHRGARFVATNTDATLPTHEGLWPGNGAVVAALERASGRVAEVAGKPQPALLHRAQQHLGVEPVLFVGDRHETDVAGAAAAGVDSALVLTGATRREQVPGLDPTPTYVLDSLAELLDPTVVAHAGDSVTVRTAVDADIPAIVALWDGAGMLAYTPEAERDIRLVMERDGALQVVAEVDGTVRGVAVGTFDGRRGWLMRVAVDPALRRRGVGRRMVDVVEARMRSRGVPQIDLLTFDDNAVARAFWERLGYRKTSPVAMFVKALAPSDPRP
ncbi:MAG TPA: HAD-IIA family hydrolase [Egibacteraceae bacterium]|nr:HAD-IIA family hydrolase [Egibacteraceae bacterium]